MNIFVHTLKPDKCHSFSTAARRWFLELSNGVVEKTALYWMAPSLSLKPLGLGISCMPVGVYFRCTCERSLADIHILTHFSTLLQVFDLLNISQSPVVSPVTNPYAFRSLLKTWFFQSSPVSHPSFSSDLLPTYWFLPILSHDATVPSGSGDVALGLTLRYCHPWTEI